MKNPLNFAFVFFALLLTPNGANAQTTLAFGNLQQIGIPNGNTSGGQVLNGVDVQPDLEVTKVASAPIVSSGQTLSYTITVTNNGTTNATGVKLKDMIPSGLTFQSCSFNGGSTSSCTTSVYSPSTGIWDVGAVNQGATHTLLITVTVN
jgi:uncharacterized repeat protein (TIGR01451 family)